MKSYFFWFLICSACFYVGWVFGASTTARRIADAIMTGELSLEQRIDSVASQIESGVYRPGP
jgi:hypothetical protein